MDQTIPDDSRTFVLGLGAGLLSLLLGLALAGIAAFGDVGVLQNSAVAGGLVGIAFAFGVAGLYEITARGVPRRGVADLVAGGALVLGLLGPYGSNPRLFVATAAIALFGGAVYHAALVSNVVSVTEEPASEMEAEETS